MCKICDDTSEKRKAIERQLTLGNIDLKSAADELNVNEKTLWYHLKHHLQESFEALADKDVQTQLKHLMRKLHELVDQLLSLPAENYARHLPALIRELRELITTLGKTRGEVPPDIAIQINILNKYTTWMREHLCDTCKLKAAEMIEQYEAIEST